MKEEQLERSVLDGKDREQLHEIAGAMGVRAATRMKKADLIDAILDAANGAGASENDTATASTDPEQLDRNRLVGRGERLGRGRVVGRRNRHRDSPPHRPAPGRARRRAPE